MPTLTRFYGIAVKMYFLQSEHNPPHVYAIYGEDAGAFDIRTGTLIDGGLPARASDLVKEWIAIHRSELLEMWETQEFRKLDPLA